MTGLATKDPDVSATYTIDWRSVLLLEMRRDTEYSLGDVSFPNRATGFYYECTVAGRTSAHWPTLPRASDETVQDGSVEWTARHPDDATVLSVASAVWTVPSGITQDSQEEDGFFTRITLSGGTDGEDYDLSCRMTPTSGPAVEQTIVIPVRAQ